MAYSEPLHPVTKQPLSELDRYIWRLRVLAQEALVLQRGVNKAIAAARAANIDPTKVLNEELLYLLTGYALITVCKFLEIWDHFGALAKDSEKVRDVRRALQPWVDRIRQWKGLETFRNTALAHPYLTKVGEEWKIIGPWQLLFEGRAPTYHAEILLLTDCVRHAILGVLTAFAAEYEALKPILASSALPPTAPSQGVQTGAQIPDALRPIAREADKRLKESLGIVAGGSIAQEFMNIILRIDLPLS